MKKFLYALFIFGLTIQLFSRWGEGTYVVYENADYDKTVTKTYSNNRCARGYHKLKKYLKNDAKEFCAREFGTHGVKMFFSKKFTKIECIKIKRQGHKTKVKVTGKFKAMCKKN